MKIHLLLSRIKEFFANNTNHKIDIVLSIAFLVLVLLSNGKCNTMEKHDKSLVSQSSKAWFRVSATRIGLVGNITASGHIIEENDIFVALPDRSALNKMVRVKHKDKIVCCKVLDVGPWSTKDDYWATGNRPLAESKKQIPERSREVTNCAGIDLSDGLWEELGVSKNVGIITVEWSFLEDGN